MKSFFAIIITFVLAIVNLSAANTQTGTPMPDGTGQDTEEFGAFITCVPMLTMEDIDGNPKTVEHLGNFFVNGTQRIYEINDVEFLRWKLTGPMKLGDNSDITYTVEAVNSLSNYQDNGVSLAIEWTVESLNYDLIELGSLYLADVKLEGGNTQTNCGGTAIFRIDAIKLTVNANVTNRTKNLYSYCNSKHSDLRRLKLWHTLKFMQLRK
jgi:hypothetical protein